MATSNIINYGTYVNTTRYAPGSAASYAAFSFTYTKRQSATSLIISAVIPARGGSNGTYYYVEINGVKRYTGICSTYYSGERGIHILQRWNGVAAGTATIAFGWQTGNGSSDQHFAVLHPNSTDDVRNRTSGSNWMIWEISGVQNAT